MKGSPDVLSRAENGGVEFAHRHVPTDRPNGTRSRTGRPAAVPVLPCAEVGRVPGPDKRDATAVADS